MPDLAAYIETRINRIHSAESAADLVGALCDVLGQLTDNSDVARMADLARGKASHEPLDDEDSEDCPIGRYCALRNVRAA